MGVSKGTILEFPIVRTILTPGFEGQYSGPSILANYHLSSSGIPLAVCRAIPEILSGGGVLRKGTTDTTTTNGQLN